ncbi:MAG: prepilin-type N-terminal cleavage/methylation domain-containing protein [Deltaproteobacteria bacterium]|nr:prepilin-type N-terminal cleavage/methylation domain-containing protein [Deltaproteobacteria bacterium]
MLYIKQDRGFTLIELIVVVSLVSIMLFLYIPKFQKVVVLDNTKKVSRWIIGKIKALKEGSITNYKNYFLHIDLDNNRIWVTDELMSEEEMQNAEQQGLKLPDDIKLVDVEYPGKNKILFGRADIFFYKKGYSDKALIHIEDSNNKQFSFLIEPFLSNVRLYEDYVEFEN